MVAAITQAAVSRAQGSALPAKAEPEPGPKRLSLADLREAARRRREGCHEGLQAGLIEESKRGSLQSRGRGSARSGSTTTRGCYGSSNGEDWA
jgi:hypothetical protein